MFGPSLANDNAEQEIDFLSFATVFLALGLIPFTLEVMEFNADICRAKSDLVRALTNAATIIESKHPDGAKHDYWLMKECYDELRRLLYFDFVPDIAQASLRVQQLFEFKRDGCGRCALLRTASRLVLLMLVVGAFHADYKRILSTSLCPLF